MPVKRILIVDDARDVGRMYQQALRSAYPKVAVTYVPSAEEAMVEVITFKVDLMVVDIRLPGMSGFDLVKRVRARQPGVRVIMITGMEVNADLVAKSQAVGAANLLGKPVSVAAFLSAVQELLGPEETPQAVEVEPAPKKPRGKTTPLKMPLPEPPPMVEVAGPAGPTLSEALSDLRTSLGATAVLLLDDTGRITAQAGDGQAPGLAEQMAPDLMAGLSSLQRVSRQLGAALPEAAQVLRGKEQDLVISPVGRFALLLFLKPGPSALKLGLAFEEALHAQKELVRILNEMGLNVSPIEGEVPTGQAPATAAVPVVADEAVEVPPEELRALAALLKKPAVSPSAQDADSYWDNLGAADLPVQENPDMLSYEQARKLGLLPDEEAGNS